MTQQLQEKQDTIQIAAAIESLLFVSGRPLEYAELRKLLNVDDTGLTGGLDLLDDQLESQGRGIRLQRLGEQVQLVTAPENARYIAALLDLPMTAGSQQRPWKRLRSSPIANLSLALKLKLYEVSIATVLWPAWYNMGWSLKLAGHKQLAVRRCSPPRPSSCSSLA